jgi:hypothetical protein
MAAVAEAAQRAGVARERISFFPGHGGEPGQQASASTRAWWNTTPRYTTPLEELRWNGHTLPEALAAITPSLCHTNAAVTRIEDFSSGLWREAEYSHCADWPAVTAPFERAKYRITLTSGDGVLWKFAGLAVLPNGEEAASSHYRVLAERAAAGWTAPPLGTAFGFLAMRWIDGAPLSRADFSPELAGHIGRYIAGVAAPPLSRGEQEAALERLAGMLFYNTQEALSAAAAHASTFVEAARRWTRETAPRSYGDGRLAPHEWIRARDGQVFKVDSLGHDYDHTLVGQQTVAWDVAGAIIEWRMNDAGAALLLTELAELIPTKALRFYGAAYAAFRLGLSTLCAAMTQPEDAEYSRLQRAAEFYRNQLAQLLEM